MAFFLLLLLVKGNYSLREKHGKWKAKSLLRHVANKREIQSWNPGNQSDSRKCTASPKLDGIRTHIQYHNTVKHVLYHGLQYHTEDLYMFYKD